jgi:hypothetical protein
MGREAGGGSRGGAGGGGSLTAGEVNALRQYSGGDYQAINAALTGRETAEDDDFLAPPKLSPAQIQTKIQQIDAALEKLPGYKGTVTRGLQLDIGAPGSPQEHAFQRYVKQFAPGTSVTFPEYLSTSAKGGKSFRGNLQFTIQATGKRGKNIAKYTQNPSEREVLFQRGSRFKVASVKPIIREVGTQKIKRTVGYEIALTE